MSFPEIRQSRPPDRPVRQPRWNPLVTVLMILLGLPLLAPGFCVWMAFKLRAGGGLAEFAMLFCLPGLAMIGFGIRRLFVRPVTAPAVSELAKLMMLLVLLAIVGLLVLYLARALRWW